MDEIRCSIEVREDESRESPGRMVGNSCFTYGEQASDQTGKNCSRLAVFPGRSREL